MLRAMYGDAGFTFPFNTATGVGDASQLKKAFLGKGKMIQPNWKQAENTTISAIITVMSIQPFRMELMDMMLDNPGIDIEAEMRQTIPNFDPDLEVPRVSSGTTGLRVFHFRQTCFAGTLTATTES